MSFYMHHVEREILSALIDGELTPDERRYVHDHLQRCEACREVADEFGQLRGLVGDLPQLIAPESFVSQALRPERPSRLAEIASIAVRGRRRWVALSLATAAIGVTLAGLAAPQPASEPPLDRFIARHVGAHSGVEAGGQVLFAVNGR